MSCLLDTNVVYEIRRGSDLNVQAWAEAVPDSDVHLSVLTVGEIRKGIERLRVRDVPQAQTFAAWLTELERRSAQRILPVNTPIAQEWGRLNAFTPRPTVASLIAATALVHGLTGPARRWPSESTGLSSGDRHVRHG